MIVNVSAKGRFEMIYLGIAIRKRPRLVTRETLGQAVQIVHRGDGDSPIVTQQAHDLSLSLAVRDKSPLEAEATLDDFCGDQNWGRINTISPQVLCQHLSDKRFFGLAFHRNQDAVHLGRPPSRFFSHRSPMP